MAKGSKSQSVLVFDDEPEYLQWVADYFESKGLTTKFVTNLGHALQAIATDDYRLILVDMNVPGVEAIDPRILSSYPLAHKYPGIALAVAARNKGYGAHTVIAYTVHDDEAADKELKRLHCRYVLKGRPDVFRKVVEASLKPAPKPVRRVLQR
jgi:CheY-like chemotaxis protein